MNFIVNIAAYFGLTYNFKGTLKQRVFAASMTYIIMMCCELLIVSIDGYIHFPIDEINNYNSIYGVIGMNIAYFTVGMTISRIKTARKDFVFPIVYWFAILIIPLSTMIIVFSVLTNRQLSKSSIIINIALLLTINFFAFFLYEKIAKYAREEKSRQLTEQKNQNYKKQLKIMETSLETTQALKHDIKNHLAAIYTLLNSNCLEEAKNHIQSIVDVYRSDRLFHSGNAAIDSILNFKLQEANQWNIVCDVKGKVPNNIQIESYNAAIILGNLLDNAIQAVKELSENRYIQCDMKYEKGLLLITISNPYNGKLLKRNNKIISLKRDKNGHGYGLENVKQAVEEYNGAVEINSKNNIFRITILMYV